MNPFLESQKENGMTNQTQQTAMPQTNPTNLINDIMLFRKSFTGNPKAVVDQMVSSGKINQEQYNFAVNMANQVRAMFCLK